jgi:hypothetical protein
MKAILTDKRPCRLSRGEMRRVPQARTFPGLVGYHLCCPACGFPNAVLHGVEMQRISEHEDGTVSFSVPAKCVYCRVILELIRGELTTKEGPDVRAITFR